MKPLSIALASGAFAFVFLFLASSFTVVDVGHRGVVTLFGRVQDTVLSEGFHFVNPLSGVHGIDVRTQKVEVEVSAASKDLQSVTTTIAVNYVANPATVKNLYQDTAGAFESTLLSPAIQETVKAATAQYTAEELITKRAEVKDLLVRSLANHQNTKFFMIQDASFVNFSFSDSFDAAIEAKVKAEQDALASKNKLEQTKYEAEQKIVTAKAEAESLRIQAEALANNSSLVELEAIRAWDGKLPNYTGGQIPFINIK